MENCELEKLKGKNWMATMALCWLFGAFGAHRFYTGKTNSAWIMLVFTITGILAPISSIWMVIDGIIIALGQFKHEDGSDLYERIPGFGYFYIAYIAFFVILGLILTASFAAIFTAAIQNFPQLQVQ